MNNLIRGSSTVSETFDRKNSFGWLINVLASQAAKAVIVEIKEYDLTIALWPTLLCLWEQEGVTQRDIALKSKVDNSTTTRTIDKLEKLGLVERKTDPGSRRSYRIYLTEKGSALKEVLLPLPLSINERMLAPLEPEERVEIIRLLRKMIACN